MYRYTRDARHIYTYAHSEKLHAAHGALHLCVCRYICVCVCVCACVCVCVHIIYMCIYMYIYINVQVYIYMYIYKCTDVRAMHDTYIHMHIDAYMRIHEYPHVHSNTYTSNTYIHTHTCI